MNDADYKELRAFVEDLNEQIKMSDLHPLIEELDSMVRERCPGYGLSVDRNDDSTITMCVMDLSNWKDRYHCTIPIGATIDSLSRSLTSFARATSSMVEARLERQSREVKRRSWVSPENHLKPFLTPRQELGIN